MIVFPIFPLHQYLQASCDMANLKQFIWDSVGDYVANARFVDGQSPDMSILKYFDTSEQLREKIFEDINRLFVNEADLDEFMSCLKLDQHTCGVHVCRNMECYYKSGIISAMKQLWKKDVTTEKLKFVGILSAQVCQDMVAACIAPDELNTLQCNLAEPLGRGRCKYDWVAVIGNMWFTNVVYVKQEETMQCGVPLPDNWEELPEQIRIGRLAALHRARDIAERGFKSTERIPGAWGHRYMDKTDAIILCEYAGQTKPFMLTGVQACEATQLAALKKIFARSLTPRYDYPKARRQPHALFRWWAQLGTCVVDEISTSCPEKIVSMVHKTAAAERKLTAAGTKASRNFQIANEYSINVQCQYRGRTNNGEGKLDFEWQVRFGSNQTASKVVSVRSKDALQKGVPVPDGWRAAARASRFLPHICQQSAEHAMLGLNNITVSCQFLGMSKESDMPQPGTLEAGHILHLEDRGFILLASHLEASTWLVQRCEQLPLKFPAHGQFEQMTISEDMIECIVQPSRQRLWSKGNHLHFKLAVERRGLGLDDALARAAWHAEEELAVSKKRVPKLDVVAAARFQSCVWQWPLSASWEKELQIWFAWEWKFPGQDDWNRELVGVLANNALYGYRTVPYPKKMTIKDQGSP